jgi:hypothetical protein
MDTKNDIKLPDRLKNLPFEVPKGYFDSLPTHIMQKCTTETVQKRTLWQAAKPILTFAAGFLLLVGLSKIMLTVVDSVKPKNENYLSQTQSDENAPALFENELSDEMKDEIIAYFVDEQSVPIIFIEDEYID